MRKFMLPDRQSLLPYSDFVKKVNSFSWKQISDQDLKVQLKTEPSDLPRVYSILKEIILRTKGISLFDTQIAAACSMQQGHIAELPTGEGKTLAAAVTAACFAMQGRRVHILVFNDYLAKRDWVSNSGLFTFCGLSCNYITQSSDSKQRKKAYAGDIVYLSAKEAGFDYLRDFTCETKDSLTFPESDVAIVDEADSILIDEARIPMVLAGNIPKLQNNPGQIDTAVSVLKNYNIEINKTEHLVWLNDSGINTIERFLGLNLYDERNQSVLAMVNASLEAHFLLEKDRDYIVKNGTIQIVDESTGRVSLNRKFPDILHRAVEAKEKINADSQTSILNSMTMQSFLLLYKTLCGMTGTVKSSAKVVGTMYELEVDVIPPHVPCIRKDHPDRIFEDEKEQTEAVLEEIEHSFKEGQPVLLGTQSVSESERYSALLCSRNIPHHVLNARNDEAEAEIIARAGEPYRITVSTNMAGRGVDIKLGGINEEERGFVKKVGGLNVISTGINNSLRIDNQLRGRAGRQGDPGECTFFICMKNSILATYFSTALRNDIFHSIKQPGKIIREAQKIKEGEDAEARYMLERYAYILEQQRKLVTAYRAEILLETRKPGIFNKYKPELWEEYVSKVGINGVEKAERQLTLYFINQHWADYLSAMEYIRNGINLVIIGRKNPLDEYHRVAVAAFEEMSEDIKQDVVSSMQKYRITEDGINMEEAGLKGATTTWTYMIDESRDQFSSIPGIKRKISSMANGTVFSLSQLYSKIKRLFSK